MKKVYLLYTCILFLLIPNVFAQTDSTAASSRKVKPVFEVGINIYGLTVRAGDFYTRYNLVRDNQFFSGIYLKRFVGKNALRYSIEYSRRSVHYGKDVLSRYDNNRGELGSLELKFGYQRLLNTKRIAPYLFTDAECTFFRTINYPRYDFIYSSSITYPGYNYRFYTISGTFLSLSPGIGVRWSIKPHVFINAEAAAQLFYARERPLATYEMANTVGINAKPLKLSIGFIF